jgi:hypothetical protein
MMNRRSIRHIRSVLGVSLLATIGGLPGTSAASSETIPPGAVVTVDTSHVVAVRSGDVAVVDVNKRSAQVPHGGSATEFSLEPPSGAMCPGDSMNDSWRVQTFIIPAAADPGTIQYGVNGPTGEHQYSVYDKFTAPVVDYLTVPNPGPGQPGRIDMLPPMSFAVFPPGELPDGRYRIGIACTYFGKTANYWDTEILLAASAGDKPAHLVWRLAVAPADVGGTHTGSSATWIFTATGVLCAAALGWLLWQRGKARSNTRTTRAVPTTSTFSKEPK